MFSEYSVVLNSNEMQPKQSRNQNDSMLFQQITELVTFNLPHLFLIGFLNIMW